jgi:hypothetical protein
MFLSFLFSFIVLFFAKCYANQEQNEMNGANLYDFDFKIDSVPNAEDKEKKNFTRSSRYSDENDLRKKTKFKSLANRDFKRKDFEKICTISFKKWSKFLKKS